VSEAAESRASVEQLRALHGSLRVASERLRAVAVPARAERIAEAARTLLDGSAGLGQALRGELLHSTGLSAAGIEHGLRTTLGLFERDALLALHASRPDAHGTQLAVAVLAGNLFSAAARPLLLPLLCGSAVLAKASSTDDVLPRFLSRALAAVEPRLGDACAVVTFAHGDAALAAALLQGADVVSIYGSDRTVVDLAARMAASTRVLAHGHGLGVLALGADALGSDVGARELAARAARDVAAYDQCGCLSPHAVLVQEGGAVDGRGFARLLGDALQACERELPRGALPVDSAAERQQWLGVAAALGELHRGATWAVSYEVAAPLRPSPGHRHIAVYDCADLTAMRARLAPLGKHLKALGIAGPTLRSALSSLAPYSCDVGAMQNPPLDARLDGLHPLQGF
jgi:hypothetical protein